MWSILILLSLTDSLANAFVRFPFPIDFPFPIGTPSSPDITYDDYPESDAKPPHHSHDHHKPKPPQPTIPHVRVYPDGSTEYELLIVTDLDKASRAGEWLWRAVSRRGRLTLNRGKTHVNISWEIESEHNLTSSMNVKGRAMELSDLSVFHNRILTPDDRTGMISEIKDNEMIPWVFLNSGPGNTTSPFKCEWMTIKHDLLYVGSHGNIASICAEAHTMIRAVDCRIEEMSVKYSRALNVTELQKCTGRVMLGAYDGIANEEYVDKKGNVLHRNNMWIKTITPKGKVTNIDWTAVYDRIRKSVGISPPGYLTHEAVQWSKIRGQWYFLPRKESRTVYDEGKDERKGSNLLITGSPNLKRFTHIRVGEQYFDRGYSAFDFIPRTRDRIIAALKTKEVTGEPTETYVTVFTTNGRVLLEDQKLEGNYKFEGLYFI